jgi:Protein kinase domain/Domain of unknown function (DUF4062)/TIR domain
MPTVLPLLRVFLSSTALDLYEHRTAVINAILRMHQFPIDMRYFNAQATGTASSNSIARIAEADVVILLIAWRYGTVQSNGLSITHQEYQEAVRLNKPILAFLADNVTQTMDREVDLFPSAKRDIEHEAQMRAFRQEISDSGLIIDTFDTPPDLGMKAAAALSNFILQHYDRFARHISDALPPCSPTIVSHKHKSIQRHWITKGQHVFISCSQEDDAFALQLSKELEKNGVGVWTAHKRLRPRTLAWETSIRKGVLSAQGVIYIASLDGVNSLFVRDELDIAHDNNISIHPIWARGEIWLDCIPLGMGGLQYIDGRKATYSDIAIQLIQALRIPNLTYSHRDISHSTSFTPDKSWIHEVVRGESSTGNLPPSTPFIPYVFPTPKIAQNDSLIRNLLSTATLIPDKSWTPRVAHGDSSTGNLPPSMPLTPPYVFFAPQQITQHTSGEIIGFGRYCIERVIAFGGMGIVYAARDQHLQRHCAVKELLDSFTGDEERREAIDWFRREANLLHDLHHSAIPRVRDWFEENGRYYLVMDFIPGRNLAEVIDQERPHWLSEGRVRDWGIQVCHVLGYLHHLNIIFCDIKPANLMATIDKSGKEQIKLIDFGVARNLHAQHETKVVVTYGFAAPEQMQGQPEPRSDIYSLGSTLHCLLSRHNPATNKPNIYDFPSIRTLRPDITAEFESVIIRALAARPTDRWATADDMGSAIEALPPCV